MGSEMCIRDSRKTPSLETVGLFKRSLILVARLSPGERDLSEGATPLVFPVVRFPTLLLSLAVDEVVAVANGLTIAATEGSELMAGEG